jgi:hypothetical protein
VPLTRVFDDWTGWNADDRDGVLEELEPVEAVNRVLASVRGAESKTVACLGRPASSRLRFLAASFARVVTIHPGAPATGIDEPNVETRDRQPFDLTPFRDSFDAVLVVEPLDGRDLPRLDRHLASIRHSLVEGGLLLATFPAAPRSPVAREVRLLRAASEADGPTLHEIEVQYRLRRAGFRGLRLRRMREGDPSIDGPGERILALAVRRANN